MSPTVCVGVPPMKMSPLFYYFEPDLDPAYHTYLKNKLGGGILVNIYSGENSRGPVTLFRGNFEAASTRLQETPHNQRQP